MFEDADKFLKIAVGLGILAAGLGVGYHYAIYIPQHEGERIAAEEKREQEKTAAAEKLVKDRVTSAKSEYENCMRDAAAAYHANWDSECRLNGINKKSAGCSLSSDVAKDEMDTLRHNENVCLEIYKTKI